MLSLLVATLLSAAVKVETPAGAPRIVVDDRPVPGWMFWGAAKSSPIFVGTQGELVQFDFTAAADSEGRGTLHFRFGDTPGDVYLDAVQVVDLQTNAVVLAADFEQGPESFTKAWTIWPVGAANTVGSVAVQPGVGQQGSAGLHVQLKAPADGHWPDFHLYTPANLKIEKDRRYRVSFWAKCAPARSLNVSVYRPGPSYVQLGGPDAPFSSRVYASQIRLAGKVGVPFVSFPVSMPWPAPGKKLDWTPSERQCQAVLDANPNARLVPRIGMGPPDWWRQAHPEHMMHWEDGPHHQTSMAPASALYRREASQRLAALVAHLEEKFGPKMAGYHPCGQNTGEWFYFDSWKPKLSGYAPVELEAWHTWLAQRYPSDEALQRAWSRGGVTRAAAPLPTPAERSAAPAGTFRDPQRERNVLDFNLFQQQMMVELVCDLAHAVRQGSAGKKLVIFFYGYVFEFGALGNGPAVAGHYALRRALQCPDIDVLCSPISYFDRGLGQSAPSMTAAESVALAGKLWLNEDDTATHLSVGNAPGHKERTSTMEDTNALLVRNAAQEALRNFGMWWMDLGATGWFDHPDMWAQLPRLRPVNDALLARPTPFRPEVAAVIDETSMLHVAARGSGLTRPAVYEVRAPLARMGTPYGQYLQDDVLAGRVSAKVYALLTPWVLSAPQRQQLRAATRGANRLWCYAPGYIDGDRYSLAAMQELTGFRVARVTLPKCAAAPTAAGQKLGLTQPLGSAAKIEPLFAVTDAKPEEILARYEDGSVAVAVRQLPDGVSWFVGPPGLTSELLRAACRRAGVHLFTETDCNVYANGPYVTVHSSGDGPLTVNFSRSGVVYDVMTQQRIGPGPQVTLPLPKARTAVLELRGE